MGWQWRSPLLVKLFTIHTERRMKDGSELGSFPFVIFVILMAVSFIITTILGIVMAIKFGRNRRAVLYCLASGVIIPLALVLLRALGKQR